METQILTKNNPHSKEIFKEYKLTTSKDIVILKVETFEEATRPKGENYSRDNKRIKNQISLF